jgi:transposase
MPNDHEKTRRAWRIPDEWWERLEPLLPPRQPHPLGGHRPRGDDRKALEAIFGVRRTGCQWQALNKTKLGSRSSAHRRCHAWVEADVFVALGEQGLGDYETLQGMDGAWLAMDGAWLAMDGARTKALHGGEKGGHWPPQCAGPRRGAGEWPRFSGWTAGRSLARPRAAVA